MSVQCATADLRDRSHGRRQRRRANDGELNRCRYKDRRTAAKRSTVYTKVGRVGSPIRCSLVMTATSRLDELTLQPSPQAKSEVAVVPLPATSELIVRWARRRSA